MLDRQHSPEELNAAPDAQAAGPTAPLTDPFGRSISYLRISVTDRCDFRCFYCMSEHMTFLPKTEVLTLEELDRLCTAFVRKGVRKIRITGGEPLVRRDIMSLFAKLSRHLDSGTLNELTLTTNASQLAHYSKDLYAHGVRRINVSLDTLDPQKFKTLTRGGKLERVLQGIEAARTAGLRIKINTVALKKLNEHEIPHIIEWAHGLGMDLTLIETMPLGEVDGDRMDHYLPLPLVRQRLEESWTLSDLEISTGGPARYVKIAETGGKVGFITPLSHTFCASCNRVRVTCTGRIYMCLGQEAYVDLKEPLRYDASDDALNRAIERAIGRKPEAHDFAIERPNAGPAVSRHMSVTGG